MATILIDDNLPSEKKKRKKKEEEEHTYIKTGMELFSGTERISSDFEKHCNPKLEYNLQILNIFKY